MFSLAQAEQFGSGLKAHKTRIHAKEQQTLQISYDFCDFKAINKAILTEHKKNEHKASNKRPKEIFSPSSSPPRKKQENSVTMNEELHEGEEELMDIEIEATDMIKRMLENKIIELEKLVIEQKEENQIMKLKLDQHKDEKVLNMAHLKNTNIPRHLSALPLNQLEKLRGYTMRYRTIPDSSCLENSFAVHAYENEDEGKKVKKMINNHVADNWPYYKHKIGLPYKERVGVGKHSYIVDEKNA